jgi:NAD(P)-dependent dehydrogenase (short-subunit alcohol dehydrogenase family)
VAPASNQKRLPCDARGSRGLVSDQAPRPPWEIAAATLYLASDEARFVDGTVLTIDGGFTAQ